MFFTLDELLIERRYALLILDMHIVALKNFMYQLLLMAVAF